MTRQDKIALLRKLQAGEITTQQFIVASGKELVAPNDQKYPVFLQLSKQFGWHLDRDGFIYAPLQMTDEEFEYFLNLVRKEGKQKENSF